MRLLALLCIVTCVASPMAAQQVLQVRSGEHATYSRLVIYTDPSSGWEVSTNGRQSEILLPDITARFETSSIFDRMPRTRIVGVSSAQADAGATLQLRLNCDCTVSAISMEGRMIVVDVGDPDPNAAPSDSSQAEDMPMPGLMEETVSQPSVVPVPDVSNEVAEDMQADSDRVELQEPPGDMPLPSTDMEFVRRQMIEQLMRAADQGVVTFSPAAEPSDIMQDEMVEDNASPLPDAATPMADTPADPVSLEELSRRLREQAQIRVETVFDRDGGALPQDDTDGDRDPGRCIDAVPENLTDWGGAKPFHLELPLRRADLLMEFDEPNPVALAELVQLYLFYGFAAEAMSYVRAFPGALENEEVLAEITRLIAGQSATISGPFADLNGCPGFAGMWYALATDDQTEPDVLEVQSIQDAFAAIPIEMRRVIGPRLARAFLSRGQGEAARAIFALMDRAGGLGGPESDLLEADLMVLDGRYTEAEAIYSRLFTTNAINAQQALLSLADSQLSRGQRLSTELLTDLSSTAYPIEDTKMGRDLLRAYIRGQAGRDAFPAAWAVLAQELEEQPDHRGALQDVAVEILMDAEPDPDAAAAFANALLQHPNVLPEDDRADPARASAANALTDLGLPNVGLDLLVPALGRNVPEARFAEARAHYASDLPGRALTALGELNTVPAQILRARAQLALNDVNAARATITAMQEEDRPEELIWLVGLWDGVAQSERSDRQAMARFMNGAARFGPEPLNASDPANPLSPEQAFAEPEALGDDLSLEGVRRLLEVNEQARSFIDDSLNQ